MLASALCTLGYSDACFKSFKDLIQKLIKESVRMQQLSWMMSMSNLLREVHTIEA